MEVNYVSIWKKYWNASHNTKSLIIVLCSLAWWVGFVVLMSFLPQNEPIVYTDTETYIYWTGGACFVLGLFFQWIGLTSYCSKCKGDGKYALQKEKE